MIGLKIESIYLLLTSNTFADKDNITESVPNCMSPNFEVFSGEFLWARFLCNDNQILTRVLMIFRYNDTEQILRSEHEAMLNNITMSSVNTKNAVRNKRS